MSVRIPANVLGQHAWGTNVDTGEGMPPIVSLISSEAKGEVFSLEQANALLPAVHTSHLEAEIVPA